MASPAHGNFDINAALAQIAANPYSTGWGDLPGQQSPLSSPSYYQQNNVKPSSYYWSPTPGSTNGYWIQPGTDGNYMVAQAKPTPDGRPGIYANTPYDTYDGSGKYVNSGQYGSNVNPDDESWKQFGIGAAFMLGPFAAAIGGAGAGAAGAGVGGGGAVAPSAGMLGDATAAGYGGLDAAGATSLGGGASIPGAGFLGDATAAGYGGLDAAGAATLGGGASIPGAGGVGAGAAGTAGAVGAAGAGGVGGSSALPSLGALSKYIGPAATVGGSLLGANATKDAANAAAGAQTAAAQAGINEWARQFDTVRQLLGPYNQAGTQAIGLQSDLAGLNGADKQNAAITQLQSMPAFQSQLKLGENRILQNASATGGLRGGNTQGALEYFAPSLLAQTINDQYSRLGGLSGLGENAAAGVGTAAMTTAGATSGLLQQGGAAQAGADLAGGVANQKLYGGLASALGQLFGYSGNPMTSGTPVPV